MDNNKKVETDIPDHFCFNPTSSFSPKDKDTNKEQEDEIDKVMNNEMKENLYSCTKCDFKVKKEATLKRHTITKHEEHVCKECKEKCSNFMELLKHIAKYHTEEPLEETEINNKGENGAVEEEVKVDSILE